MKKMTLREFSAFQSDKDSSEYIYSTENQNEKDMNETVRYSLAFNQMIVSFAPNIICFRNNFGYFLLKQVKYILQGEADSTGERVINIVCGNKKDNEKDKIHTVLIR